MALPASRDNSGALNTLYTAAFESVAPGVQDIVFKETTLLNVAQVMGLYKVKNYSHHHIVPVLDKDDAEVKSFTGLETLPTSSTMGARSAYYNFANYATNITVSWEEQQQIRDPHQIVDLLETRSFKAYRALGERLDRDMFWGNSSNSKNILGLEQAIAPYNQEHFIVTNSSLVKPRWQFRQAANVFAGIDRDPFTADGIGGTGWENLSYSFKNNILGNPWTTATPFGVSSNVPNDCLKGLAHFYQMLSWGTTMPDLIISSVKPYEDYQNCAASYLQYLRNGTDATGMNLGWTTTRYKGADWIYSDRCVASGTVGDATAGTDMIYLLNTDYMELGVCEGADFEQTEFKTPVDQAGAVAQILWRGQMIFTNPRYSGVIFNYNT